MIKRVVLLTCLVFVLAFLVPARWSGLRALAAGHNVVLSWTASTSATTYPTGTYSIFRGTTAGGEATTPIASGVSTVGYTDTNVTANQTYYYEVAFCVGGVCSAMSNEASALVPLLPGDLAAPSGLTGSAH